MKKLTGVSHSATTQAETDAMNLVLDKLRDANEKYEAWDILANNDTSEGKGFNDYHHPKKEK